ncbi:MAG: hypothetical protein HOV96_24340 [Nonomuraea sp.]|nr:hypothetical protein [Nonomuraea sp.]NUS04917.1 hypothetical protein [Nonomuraea sp.]
MCTASFRMPMEDVGRLLDTLDDGYAEATGEQPAVPAHDPGTEVMPGTGTYHRPAQHAQQQPPQPQTDERPTAALSPNDVLVARGPAPQDKLVASFGETTGPRETPPYGDRSPFTGPQYVEPPAAQYPGDPHSGPHYTGDPHSGAHYAGDPFSGPQYTGDSFSGPQYAGDPFTGPQYVDSEPVYQMPGDQRRSSPLSTDPLGFPSQAADPYPPAQPQPYSSDPYGSYQQPAPQPQPQSTAGLGTPMHGIPGAGRRHSPAPAQDSYRAADSYDSYQGYQQPQAAPPNPVDPLLALGRQEQYPPSSDPNMGRPYIGDPLFSTGERLRPDQQQDYGDGNDRREW